MATMRQNRPAGNMNHPAVGHHQPGGRPGDMGRPPMGGRPGDMGHPPMRGGRPPMGRPPRPHGTSGRTSLGGIVFTIVVVAIIIAFEYFK